MPAGCRSVPEAREGVDPLTTAELPQRLTAAPEAAASVAPKKQAAIVAAVSGASKLRGIHEHLLGMYLLVQHRASVAAFLLWLRSAATERANLGHLTKKIQPANADSARFVLSNDRTPAAPSPGVTRQAALSTLPALVPEATSWLTSPATPRHTPNASAVAVTVPNITLGLPHASTHAGVAAWPSLPAARISESVGVGLELLKVSACGFAPALRPEMSRVRLSGSSFDLVPDLRALSSQRFDVADNSMYGSDVDDIIDGDESHQDQQHADPDADTAAADDIGAIRAAAARERRIAADAQRRRQRGWLQWVEGDCLRARAAAANVAVHPLTVLGSRAKPAEGVPSAPQLTAVMAGEATQLAGIVSTESTTDTPIELEATTGAIEAGGKDRCAVGRKDTDRGGRSAVVENVSSCPPPLPFLFIAAPEGFSSTPRPLDDLDDHLAGIKFIVRWRIA
jgi:hypothetical protein